MILKFEQFVSNINNYSSLKYFVFHGENIGKVDDCAKLLILEKKKSSNIDFITKYSDELKSGEFTNIVNQNSEINIFGNKTIILFNLSTEKLSKEIVDTIEKVNRSEVTIIVKSDQLSKKSSIRTKFEKDPGVVIVPCYEDTAFEKRGVIKDFFFKEKITVSEEQINTLAQVFSNQRLEILNELQKIKFLLSRKKNLMNDLQFIYRSSYFDELKFIYCLVSGNLKDYERKFDELCFSNGDQIRYTTILLNHFYRLLFVSYLVKDGESLNQAVSRLRPPIFFKYHSEFMKQLSKWKIKDLILIIKRLLKCKQKLFNGHLSSQSFFLKTMLLILNKGDRFTQNNLNALTILFLLFF